MRKATLLFLIGLGVGCASGEPKRGPTAASLAAAPVAIDLREMAGRWVAKMTLAGRSDAFESVWTVDETGHFSGQPGNWSGTIDNYGRLTGTFGINLNNDGDTAVPFSGICKGRTCSGNGSAATRNPVGMRSVIEVSMSVVARRDAHNAAEEAEDTAANAKLQEKEAAREAAMARLREENAAYNRARDREDASNARASRNIQDRQNCANACLAAARACVSQCNGDSNCQGTCMSNGNECANNCVR